MATVTQVKKAVTVLSRYTRASLRGAPARASPSGGDRLCQSGRQPDARPGGNLFRAAADWHRAAFS